MTSKEVYYVQSHHKTVLTSQAHTNWSWSNLYVLANNLFGDSFFWGGWIWVDDKMYILRKFEDLQLWKPWTGQQMPHQSSPLVHYGSHSLPSFLNINLRDEGWFQKKGTPFLVNPWCFTTSCLLRKKNPLFKSTSKGEVTSVQMLRSHIGTLAFTVPVSIM